MSPATKKTVDAIRRAGVGFNGGQVLPLRLGDDQLTELRKALQAAKGEWHEVETADGAALIKIGDVAYLRVESDENRVGF